MPVVFSTDGKPYFNRIPHLSETSNNVLFDYSKNKENNYSIKKFRRSLKNILDDIEYDDFVNKAYCSTEIISESVGHSELSITSEDIDESINGEENKYSDEENEDDDLENCIRAPIHRYHKYLDEFKGNENAAGGNLVSTNKTENLTTTMNYTTTSNKIFKVTSEDAFFKEIKNFENMEKDPVNLMMDEQPFNEEDIEKMGHEEIKEQLDTEDVNEKINNEEIKEQLDNDVANEESNNEKTDINTNNTTDKIVSSSNSNSTILKKNISNSKGSLQKLD